MTQHFEIDRQDLARYRLTSSSLQALADGAIRVRLQRFALTANNVTYAEFGDRLGYWKFFPADDGWGRMPVWGYAKVAESNHPGVGLGQRYFGFWSISESIDLSPKLSSQGFTDAAPHRQALPPIYNRYLRAPDEADSAADTMNMTFRPLFMTSFLIVHQLLTDLGSEITAVISSASSKTALGTAYCLREHGIRCVGLTGVSRVSSVQALGVYDEVKSYDDVGEINSDSNPTALVDIAGNPTVRAAIHDHLRSELVLSLAVGASHNQNQLGSIKMAGPEPVLFFAPSVHDAVVEHEGAERFYPRFEQTWQQFSQFASGWLQPVLCKGAENFGTAYTDVRAGNIGTESVLMLSF